jgi:putative ABC transport system permease protein
MKSKRVSLVVILTIGLVVGADATIFTALNAFLLRPLPVSEPSRLFRAAAVSPRGETREDFSYGDFVALRDAFPSLAAFSGTRATAINPQSRRIESVGTEMVSDRFFSILGAQLARGSEGVVISAGLERRMFGGDALGRAIEIQGKRETITGVAAGAFRGTNFANPTDVWLPLDRAPVERWASAHRTGAGGLKPAAPPLEDAARVRLIGRLPNGATLAAAQETLTRALPDRRRIARVRAGAERAMLIQPGAPGAVSAAAIIAITLMALASLVAAANVVGVLFARLATRRRDLAIRVALGATPRRVMREIVLETIPLAIPAAILAYIVATLGSRFYLAGIPMQSRPAIEVSPDARVALFTFALSAAAVFCAAMLAALYARRATPQGLTAREGSARTPALLRWIVSLQLALSVVVLIAAGLLLQTARAYNAVDPGFEYTRQLRVPVENVPLPRLRELAERLRALDGTTHVAIATSTPLSRQTRMTFRALDGEPIEGAVTYIDGDYFNTVGIRLLSGAAAAPAAVINEALAKRNPEIQHTGIAKDARLSALADPAEPHAFLPIERAPSLRSAFLLIRTRRDLGIATRDVNAVLTAFGIPPAAHRLEDSVRVDRWLAETASIVAGALAALTLLLAALGLFGVVSAGVSNRARELAIRAAHGATPAALAKLIAASSARLLIAGTLAGAALAIPAAHSLASLLFGVHPFDALTWTAVFAVIIGSVAVATALPARRAMAANPTELLRET